MLNKVNFLEEKLEASSTLYVQECSNLNIFCIFSLTVNLVVNYENNIISRKSSENKNDEFSSDQVESISDDHEHVINIDKSVNSNTNKLIYLIYTIKRFR